MKINKNILVAILFIIIGMILFISDILNPVIHPITHLFLMGSSKGKDIIFFILMGLFLISTQILKKYDIDSNKYLKIGVILGSATLICGILLEIIFRFQNGIALNTVFMSVENGISSTSILHTHILKSIFGEVITNLLGSNIQSSINTGIGIYAYIPNVAKLVILLLPLLFIILILAIQKRSVPQTVLVSFFSACLLIGSLDGGLFSTPAMLGIFGLFLVYRNGYYIDEIFKIENNTQPKYEVNENEILFIIKRYLPYIVIGFILFLRLTVGFFGTDCDYYTLDVIHPTEEINLTDLDVKNISVNENKTTYTINSKYNEMELLNDLKTKLNNRCKYYTLSWNTISYFEDNSLGKIFLLKMKEIL